VQFAWSKETPSIALPLFAPIGNFVYANLQRRLHAGDSAIGLINLCHQIERGSNRDDGLQTSLRARAESFVLTKRTHRRRITSVLFYVTECTLWRVMKVNASCVNCVAIKMWSTWSMKDSARNEAIGNATASFRIFIPEIQYLFVFFFLLFFLHIPWRRPILFVMRTTRTSFITDEGYIT